MAVDDWIAFIERYSTDNITKEEKKKQQEREDRLSLDYRDALVAAMKKNQSRERQEREDMLALDYRDALVAAMKNQSRERQEREDQAALDYRDGSMTAMKNQSRKRHQQFNEIESDDTDTGFATPASTRSKKRRNTDFTKDLLERLVATAERDSHTFEHALGGNSSIKALCSRIDEMSKQVSVLMRLAMEIMERLSAQAANSLEDL